MLHSRGELLLMLDADGATKISDLEKLENQVNGVLWYAAFIDLTIKRLFKFWGQMLIGIVQCSAARFKLLPERNFIVEIQALVILALEYLISLLLCLVRELI